MATKKKETFFRSKLRWRVSHRSHDNTIMEYMLSDIASALYDKSRDSWESIVHIGQYVKCKGNFNNHHDAKKWCEETIRKQQARINRIMSYQIGKNE